MAAFGALFGLAGLAAGDEPGGVIMMVVFGVGSAVFGASLATARVLADSTGIRYRYFISRRIPVDQIVSVGLGPGSGAGYPRVAIVVGRLHDRPVRLTALQAADTQKVGGDWSAKQPHCPTHFRYRGYMRLADAGDVLSCRMEGG